ncbi:hypothetical protein C0J52_09427 [Blattella germanica]|nr:hypothetical protein C0J52_09427 [Blattella germanica]
MLLLADFSQFVLFFFLEGFNFPLTSQGSGRRERKDSKAVFNKSSHIFNQHAVLIIIEPCENNQINISYQSSDIL